MNWSDVQPGDMIMIGEKSSEGFFKLFEHDVFFIVGVQDTTDTDMISVQMLTSTASTERGTAEHKMYRNEINRAFSVFRRGEIVG